MPQTFVCINDVIENSASLFRSLSLIGCNIGDNLEVVAEGLKLCCNLCSLDLSENDIGDSGAMILSKCLQKSLHALKLSKNKLSAKGIETLASSLRVCVSLTTLDLEGNVIGDEV